MPTAAKSAVRAHACTSVQSAALTSHGAPLSAACMRRHCSDDVLACKLHSSKHYLALHRLINPIHLSEHLMLVTGNSSIYSSFPCAIRLAHLMYAAAPELLTLIPAHTSALVLQPFDLGSVLSMSSVPCRCRCHKHQQCRAYIARH